ncbi:MAG: hypothetical protein ACRDHE_17295 [Ktedonobacterales bacterium]
MSLSQSDERDLSAGGAPLDAASVDKWIRLHVGRQVIVGCAEDVWTHIRETLTRYREVRVESAPAATAREDAITSGVAALMRLDPHALLFRLDATVGPETLATSARALYQMCEVTAALDLCFVALVGAGMTRALARSLAFEDGFALEGDEARLIHALTAQAAQREEARRRGSSPPCYL